MIPSEHTFGSQLGSGGSSSSVTFVMGKAALICDFKGVSVAWLDAFASDIRAGALASGVELVVLQDGSTGRVIARRDSRVLVDIPYVGQQEVLVDQVRVKGREAWDTEDVCEYVVKGDADMMHRKKVYTEVINRKHVGQPFKGAFVSQARRTPFKGLVAAVKAHFAKADLTHSYVWLDIFCANQALLCDTHADKEVQSARNALLCSGLHEAIAKFDDLLVYFDHWNAPTPLSRAWCVWELYGAARYRTDRKRAPLRIVLTPEECDRFVNDGLLGNFDSIEKAFSTMRVKEAECFNKEDKAAIDREIELNVPGRHNTIDSMVAEQLHAWLADVAEKAIDDHGTPTTQNWEAFVELLTSTGSLLREQGKRDKSMQKYEQALALATTHLGMQHPTVTEILSCMAIIFQEEGKLDKALQMFNQVLENTKANNDGPQTFQTVTTADMQSNIAGILVKQGEYDRALDILEHVLEIYKTNLPPGHISVADTLQSIGIAFRGQKKHAKALEAFQQALELKKSIYGARYTTVVSVADTLNSIATLLLEQQQELQKALEMHTQALEIYKANLGGHHTTVANTLVRIATIFGIQDIHDESLRVFGQALEIYRANLGPRDWHVTDTLLGMAIVLAKQRRYERALLTTREAINIYKANHDTEGVERARIIIKNIKILRGDGVLVRALGMCL